MTITPDQADRMKQAATSVPWTVHIDSNDVDEIYIYSDDGNMCIGIDLRGSYFTSHDLNLAAAAPDMAQTIAGMKWQWGVEQDTGSSNHDWRRWTQWFDTEKIARSAFEFHSDCGNHPVLFRRLVSSPEVVDGD